MKTLDLPKIRFYLICGILFALPFERIPSVTVHNVTIRLSQILGVLLIAFSLNLIRRNFERLYHTPWLFLVLFNFVDLASIALNPHKGHGLKVGIFVAFVSLLSWVISLNIDRKKLPAYLKWGLIGVIVSCLFGIYQFFGDLAGLPTWATGLRPQYTKGGIFPFPRIESTALEPLYFANYLLIPLALLSLTQLFRKIRVWPCLLLVLAIIILSLSRGAQLAAAIIVLVVIGIGLYRQRYQQVAKLIGTSAAAALVAFGMIAFGSFLYPQYNGHKNTAASSVKDFTHQATNVSQGESAEGRTLTRKLAIDAFKSHPLLGIGPGNFGSYANLKRPDKFPTTDTIVNNETLEIGAEEGLLGLALISAFILTLLYRSLRAVKGVHTAAPKLAIAGLAIGLVGIGIQYQLFSTLYITHIWVGIGILSGLLASETKVKAAN